MQDAVEAAFKLAKKVETVLLQSFAVPPSTLFKSYEDRGRISSKHVSEHYKTQMP